MRTGSRVMLSPEFAGDATVVSGDLVAQEA
jgi:hypothetical protein